MKLAVLIQTVQSLNDPTKVKALRNYFYQLRHRTDIICIQEHKFRDLAQTTSKNQLWLRANFFGQNANVAYNHNVNEPRSGKWLHRDVDIPPDRTHGGLDRTI